MHAVLFDLDCTLLDTLEDLADSVNGMLTERGAANHDLAAYRRFIGDGIADLVRRALPEEQPDDDSIQRGVERVRAIYAERCQVKTHPYPGVLELLAQLQSRGTPMAILSNKPHRFTVPIVEKMLPAGMFSAILGARDEVPKKPDPTAALDIARDLEIPPSDWLFLGDSGVDIQTAVRAGMIPIGALWGFRDRQELVENGATIVLGEPLELLDHI